MDRDSWYEARRILQSSSEANRAALGVVESAAFLVCLDDGSEPVLASDGSGRGGRCRRMLGGDGVGMHARGEYLLYVQSHPPNHTHTHSIFEYRCLVPSSLYRYSLIFSQIFSIRLRW